MEFLFILFMLFYAFTLFAFIALNWEIFLLIFIFFIIWIIYDEICEKKKIIKNAKNMLLGVYKISTDSKNEPLELEVINFKMGNVCDIYYIDYLKSRYKFKENVVYNIVDDKVYIKISSKNIRLFIIKNNFIVELKKDSEKVVYKKISYETSEFCKRDKRLEERANKKAKEAEVKKVKEIKEKAKEIEINKIKDVKVKHKEVEIKKVKEKSKEIKTKNSVSDKKEKVIKKKASVKKVNLENKSNNNKELKDIYVIEYTNENSFLIRERNLKKINMLTYKKLMFEIIPNLRKGIFSGIIVSSKENDGTIEYKLKLPTDPYFSKVYDDIILHYIVCEGEKIVILNNITPDDILSDDPKKDRDTYKGVPLSKAHTERDIFKINLLNILEHGKK